MIAGALAAAADRMAAATLVGPSLRATRPSRRDRDELERIRAEYDRPEHYSDPDTFFSPPAIPKPRWCPVRFKRFADESVDARWPSCASFAEGALGRQTHHDAAARLFLHRRPARVAMILVHGYLGGRYALEDRIWGARTLYARGVDVALATLPFHGVRAASHVSPPMFPSADARITIEATRQAIFDLRGLVLLLQARGANAVGAMGMSLGGYCVALLATLEPELAFAVPIVPLADLGDFARAKVPEPRSHAEARGASRALSETLKVTSPLARPSKLSPDRVLVVGAAADRIAPLGHARELAAHFEARLEIMPGGHLLQLGRGRALESVNRFIERSL